MGHSKRKCIFQDKSKYYVLRTPEKLKVFFIVSIVVEQNGRRTVIRVVNQDDFICSDIRT